MGMQSQKINTGTPDDGRGDTVRAAFEKLNSNLDEYDGFINRGFRVPEATMGELPDVASRNGKLLTFDYLGNPQVTEPPTLTLAYTNSTTPQDVVVTSGVLEANTTLNLGAANAGGAKPTVFAKTGADGFSWNIVDPNGGTFVVDVQYQAIRLIPLHDENIWVKQG